MPTASDMARLGRMLISDHRHRDAAVATVRAGVGAMRVETRQFVGHLRDEDVARKEAMQERAAETGRFVGQLHAETRARKRDTRRHAAQTGRFVDHLHDQSLARKRAMQRHAARTGRFMDRLHDQSLARKRDARQHAIETGDFVHKLHLGSLQRRNGAREHSAETGRFMGQLHHESRVRRRNVRRHAAETGRFVRHLHGVTRERKHEVGQLLGQARELMTGLSIITNKALAEWRRQLVAIDSGRRTASAGRRASPWGGTAVAGAESKAGERGQESKPDVGSVALAYVAGHPGTRLPKMEKALGINRIEAARTVHALLNQGRIRRDEKTRQYFPA